MIPEQDVEPEWDLTERHTTHMKRADSGPAVCVDCGVELEGASRDVRRCPKHKLESDAGRARVKRTERRVLEPVKTARSFVCRICDVQWETEALGRFLYCPSCAEQADVTSRAEKRTKTCAYRECGQSFMDPSSKNGMDYCCEEHRRREKLFRSGQVTAASGFRKLDTVLTVGPVEKPRLRRKCVVCEARYELDSEGPRPNRCPACRDTARNKTCRTCGVVYRDESEKNTRRYCDAHVPVTGADSGSSSGPVSDLVTDDPESGIIESVSSSDGDDGILGLFG